MKVFFLSFVVLGSGFTVRAAQQEISASASDHLLISISEVQVTLVGDRSSQLTLRWEGPQDEFFIDKKPGTFEIRLRNEMGKNEFGKLTGKSHSLEIRGRAVPVEIHGLKGQVDLKDWNQDAWIHLQNGKLMVSNCQGQVALHALQGEIAVKGHQGSVKIDTYQATVTVRGLNGDLEMQNFSGDSQLDKVKGIGHLILGSGATKLMGGSGSLQFEVTKGSLITHNFEGRVEGHTQEGPISIMMAPESDVNVRSQNGKVTVQAAANGAPWVSVVTQEGDLLVPSNFRVNRDGTFKIVKGRMRGDQQKGSIVVRSQEGAVIIK